jgi:hypothetical protein
MRHTGQLLTHCFPRTPVTVSLAPPCTLEARGDHHPKRHDALQSDVHGDPPPAARSLGGLVEQPVQRVYNTPDWAAVTN